MPPAPGPGPGPVPGPGAGPGPGVIVPIIGILIGILIPAAPILLSPPAPPPQASAPAPAATPAAVPATASSPETPTGVTPPAAALPVAAGSPAGARARVAPAPAATPVAAGQRAARQTTIVLSAGPAPAQPSAAAGPSALPRGGADLWIPALAGLALASAGMLMRRITRLWGRAVRLLGLEETRALSGALLVCGVAVFIAPWAVVAATGRAVNATQAQILSSWDEAGVQMPSSPPQSRAEDDRMVLSIPSLGLRRFVPNDATADYLKAYGVGWIPGTALPGDAGVVGVAGHRTTYGAPFFRLDRLAEGDAILIDYRGRQFTYRVERFETVTPSQVDVLNGSPDERLIALITCTPAYSAASRLVVLGRLEAVGLHGSGQ